MHSNPSDGRTNSSSNSKILHRTHSRTVNLYSSSSLHSDQTMPVIRSTASASRRLLAPSREGALRRLRSTIYGAKLPNSPKRLTHKNLNPTLMGSYTVVCPRSRACQILAPRVSSLFHPFQLSRPNSRFKPKHPRPASGTATS